MIKTRAFLILTISLCILSCELIPKEQFTPLLNVHCLLFEGSTQPRVILNRTYSIDEPADSTFRNFPGAEVRLWRGQDTWTFYNTSWSYQCRSKINISPSDTFFLRITHPEYDTVSGRTIMPDTFSIVCPQPGDTVTTEDSLIWTRSRTCSGYYMSFAYLEMGDTFHYNIVIPNDRLRGLPQDTLVRLPLLWLDYGPKGPLTLRICALDTNYFNWIQDILRGNFARQTQQTAGITGGIGVFGSATVCSVRVYVKHDTIIGYLPGSSPSRRKSNHISVYNTVNRNQP